MGTMSQDHAAGQDAGTVGSVGVASHWRLGYARTMHFWPSQPAVVPQVSDPEDTRATLDYIMELFYDAVPFYDGLVSLVADGLALVTPPREIVRQLANQTVFMRRALLAVKPFARQLRVDDESMGPVAYGIIDALTALDNDPTSVCIAQAFGLVCAICCAMERDLALIMPQRNVVPLECSPDFYLRSERWAPVDELGYCIRAQDEWVSASSDQYKTTELARKVLNRDRVRPINHFGQFECELLSAFGFWAALPWASMALKAPSYVDAVDRLQCVVKRSDVHVPSWRSERLRGFSMSRQWFGAVYDVVAIDPQLAQWLGEVAYVLEPDDPGESFKLYPRRSYQRVMRCFVGTQSELAGEDDVGLAAWNKIARAKRAFAQGTRLALPHDVVLRLDGSITRGLEACVVQDWLEVFGGSQEWGTCGEGGRTRSRKS